MANLDLIRSLNLQYGKASPIVRETKLFALNEAFDPDKIEKALPDSLAEMGPYYWAYFDAGLPSEVAMLFIDVCGFSTRFSGLMGEEIASFFDEYYDVVIPIIYKHKGEIDKIIGDGILCVFGKPYLDVEMDGAISAADKCAKEIIEKTAGTDFSTKIAFHCGVINYFKNKSRYYKEFTMIGKPLTEIFRLESVCRDELINYYRDTAIWDFYKEKLNSFTPTKAFKPKWLHDTLELPPLKGVDYTAFHTIKLNT